MSFKAWHINNVCFYIVESSQANISPNFILAWHFANLCNIITYIIYDTLHCHGEIHEYYDPFLLILILYGMYLKCWKISKMHL